MNKNITFINDNNNLENIFQFSFLFLPVSPSFLCPFFCFLASEPVPNEIEARIFFKTKRRKMIRPEYAHHRG